MTAAIGQLPRVQDIVTQTLQLRDDMGFVERTTGFRKSKWARGIDFYGSPQRPQSGLSAINALETGKRTGTIPDAAPRPADARRCPAALAPSPGAANVRDPQKRLLFQAMPMRSRVAPAAPLSSVSSEG